jgi:cell division septation protein DedD
VYYVRSVSVNSLTLPNKSQIKAEEDMITKMSLASGVADSELRPALAALTRGTKDIEEANKALALAQDISAGSGKDLATVSDALAKAYGGNMKGLAALSPEIKAMIKDGASLEDVMNVLGGSFGGASAAAAATATVAAVTPKAPTAPPAPSAPEPAKVDAKTDAKADIKTESKPSDSKDTGARFVVQAGTFSDDGKLREVRSKLEKAGIATYTQVIEGKEGRRVRVRVGPFTKRDEADKMANKIKQLQLQPQVLTL